LTTFLAVFFGAAFLAADFFFTATWISSTRNMRKV
jgi:hypothetical protein